ncbi:MAG: helix-turn-helix transcriptional regulator [Spirochaetales bacterium]|nr:helix-turn-helix transcriptional regulator [Spirochaetales bacterium]
MKFELKTSGDVAETLAGRLKELRLINKWKRSTLSERSGVSVGSLIRFEQTAQISLDNFLKLLSALGRLDDLDEVLLPPKAGTIDELEKLEGRISKRGSI